MKEKLKKLIIFLRFFIDMNFRSTRTIKSSACPICNKKSTRIFYSTVEKCGILFCTTKGCNLFYVLTKNDLSNIKLMASAMGIRAIK